MAIIYDNESYKSLGGDTPRTLAYKHALDISIAVYEAMETKSITQRELAKKMGVSAARLSQLLNTQSNMTLETIARFELALDIKIFESIRTRKKGERPICLNLGNSDLCPTSSNWNMTDLTKNGITHELIF